MSMPIVCPYSIGTVYYRPLHTPVQVQVPCPVCNGNRSVEIILGTGEQLTVPCEGCGLGFSFSRGYIEEWRYDPGAIPFTVASIEGFSCDEWRLKSALGEQCSSQYLYASRDEALRVSTQHSLDQQEMIHDIEALAGNGPHRKALMEQCFSDDAWWGAHPIAGGFTEWLRDRLLARLKGGA